MNLLKGEIKMKRKIMAILLILIMLVLVVQPIAKANTDLSEDKLVIVKGKTISKTSTIADVNKMFGNPKIETESAFGGKAYSYYDDNYSYYLYLETNQSGKIVSYGTIGNDFKGKRYASGDKHDMYYWHLSGTVLDDFDTSSVYGLSEYNCETSDVNTYWANYQKNSAKYLYELQKHSIAASKMLAVMDGKAFPQTYANEEIFYMNEQLKYNGSNLYEYAKKAGKTSQITFTRMSGVSFYEALPNPLQCADEVQGYSKAENFKYVLYDIDITNYEGINKSGQERYLFIDPSFLDEKKPVELTQEEKTKLANAKSEYEKYIEHKNQIKDLYIEEPNYKTLPLVAGKYTTIALQSVTDYLNIARAGLGIGTLSLNETIAENAQHKATLVSYMNSKNMPTGHYPSQPEGVSDDFFNKAMSNMNENLFWGDIQSSIVRAMNDGYGDPVTCGHRYNLINPRYTEWGVGSTASQGCHKFAGYASYNNELVAWPSNGITPIDMVYSGIGNWTAQFYKNYKTTANTTVTVKCLNNNKVYEINETSKEKGKFLRITGNSLVTFRDDSIAYEDGDVFEITLHNMQDSNGNTTDYTYRSVFIQFYNEENEKVTDITLNKNSVTLSMGASERILAKVAPENASIKLMKFKSANENIAKVRADGTITAIKEGTTKITVTCENITKTITVNVKKFKKGDINNDGAVDVRDLNYGLRKLSKGGLTADEHERGDVTGDGKYTVQDLSKLLRYLSGKIKEL